MHRYRRCAGNVVGVHEVQRHTHPDHFALRYMKGDETRLGSCTLTTTHMPCVSQIARGKDAVRALGSSPGSGAGTF